MLGPCRELLVSSYLAQHLQNGRVVLPHGQFCIGIVVLGPVRELLECHHTRHIICKMAGLPYPMEFCIGIVVLGPFRELLVSPYQAQHLQNGIVALLHGEFFNAIVGLGPLLICHSTCIIDKIS